MDDLARFVGPRTVVTVVETNPDDPNHGPLADNLARLHASTDQDGNPLEVVTLPMPSPLYFEETRLPASYANFYVANSVVLVPTFNDPADRDALAILASLFSRPSRRGHSRGRSGLGFRDVALHDPRAASGRVRKIAGRSNGHGIDPDITIGLFRLAPLLSMSAAIVDGFRPLLADSRRLQRWPVHVPPILPAAARPDVPAATALPAADPARADQAAVLPVVVPAPGGPPSGGGPSGRRAGAGGGPASSGGPAGRRPGPGGPQSRRPSVGGRPEHEPSGPPPKRRASLGPKPAQRGPEQSRPRGKRDAAPEGAERLQKALAHAGIGSRRACEELILQGRITVNGQIVRELGTRVHPRNDTVAVDGQPVKTERIVYFAVNKPKGYVSTNNDPSGRPRVVDILPEIPQRVYTVGRLDEMSVGLMILTNDGELANKLAHPKYGVEKVYRAVVAGVPSREVLDKLVEGVWLAEGKVRAKRVKPIASKGDATVLEMVLAEGKNREVRRMLAKLGHKVMTLSRVAIGPVTLKGLKPGEWRPLTSYEIDLLEKVAAGIPVPTRFKPREEHRPSAPRRGPAKHGEGAAPARPYRPRPADAGDDEPRRPAQRPPAGGRSRPPQGQPPAPPRPAGPGARRAPVPPSPRSRAPRDDDEMPTRRIIGMQGGDRPPMTPRRPGPPKRFRRRPRPLPSGPRPRLKRPRRPGGSGRPDDDES